MFEERDAGAAPRRRLGRRDRITGADRLRRSVYRLRGRLLCLGGRHEWALLRNPELGGAEAVYRLCRRCGHERDEYLPRTSWNVAGGGG